MTELQMTSINKHALLCTQLEETLSRQDAPIELIELRLAELSVLNTRLRMMVLDPLVDTKAISRRTSKAVKIISRTVKLLGQRSKQVHQAEFWKMGRTTGATQISNDRIGTLPSSD
jgi:hypothetical protein